MTVRLLRLTRTTILALLASVGLIAGGTAAVSSAASAAPATLRVSGAVSDAGGYPLPGVIVQVVRADHEESNFAPASTDWAGAFGTPKIPVDATTKYVLEVTDPTGRHRTAYSKPFAAISANRTQDITLRNAAVIRGKVTTKLGDVIKPATGVQVTAQGTTAQGHEYNATVGTSTRGAFSLGGLPSGTYSLVFLDYDEDGTRPGPLFNPICYDNVPVTAVEPERCDGAKLVTVTAGKVTTIRPQVLDDPIEGS